MALGGFRNIYDGYTPHTYDQGTFFTGSPPPSSGPVSGIPAPAPAAVATGVNPVETSYSLYGHPVPLSVFGVGRIGGEIISGPWIENGRASFIISFGVPADPSGTRTLREISFDSEVVWTSADGFLTEAFTYRFYGGTLSQTADALETAHFGTNAIAYRPQILIAFENLPLANTKFKKIPYVAAVIADSTGDDVNLGEAFERLAYSPWVGYTSSQFETSGITDGLVSGGLIFAEDAEFLGTIQQFGRFYPTWDILQTDKLRIVDRGSNVTADIVLNASRLTGNVAVTRQGQDTVKKALELSTIDPDADYTIVPFRAQLPSEPVVVTTSVGVDSAYLPAIMDSSTRAVVATLARYHEEQTRKTISGTAMAYGLEIEPGALVKIHDLSSDFRGETFKIVETLHGANYTVEFTATAILKCEIADAFWDHVVLLMGFDGLNGSQGAPGFTDESSREHGTAGVPATAHIDTSEFKFGSSLRADGNGWSALYGPSDDWSLSTSNSDQFTIECWVKFGEIRAFLNAIVACSFVDIQWYFGVSASAELTFGFKPGGGGSTVTVDSTGTTLTAGNWYFVAVDKSAAGKIRLYLNGVMVGSATPADSSFEASDSAGLEIGATGFTGGFTVNGWIDELRITKGVARYASDAGFTVPTGAFPRP